jgi:glycerol-3-phosphate dehydrogenase
MEILRWSCQLGTTALNYVKVDKLLADKDKVQGVRAEDQETGEIFEFTAPAVVNAAGPWSREISALFDQDLSELFKGSLAWNIVLNRESLSDHALAITPKKPNAQTYFLVPWKGMIMAGTGHVPWSSSRKKPIPAKEELLFFLTDLNHAIPGFNIKLDNILHIYSGLLPAAASGETTLTNREVIINHQLRGGPEGLYSISGIKFTTARLVAEKIVKKIFPGSDIKNYKPKPDYNRDRHTTTCSDDFHWFPPVDDFDWKNRMQKLIEEEAVLHLDDLIFRRTSLGDSPNRAQTISSCLCGLFDWSEERCQNEISRVKERLTALKI